MLFTKTKGLINKIETKTKSFKPFLQDLGNDFLNLAEDSFQNQKDPEGNAWKPLKPSTLKHSYKGRAYTRNGKKTKGFKHYQKSRKILQISGMLKNTLQAQSNKDTLKIGSFLPYARIHQFGGKAGKNLKVKIPKRAYLPATPKGLNIVGKRLVAERLKNFSESLKV